MKMLLKSVFISISLVLFIHQSSAMIRCYTCGMSQGDLDQRCLTDPEGVEAGSPITNCNKKYCISVRQEYKDPKGKVASMSRDCVDTPAFYNEIIEDETYRVYYIACQSALCNGGTGRDVTAGSLVADVGAVGNLLVPGTGAASSLPSLGVAVLMTLALTLQLLGRD